MKRMLDLQIPQTWLMSATARRWHAGLRYAGGIVKQLENGEAVVAQVVRVLDAARRAGVRVIFTLPCRCPGN